MPCLAALLALISPRLALFAIWIFSDILGRAYDSWVLPVLGFFLLPWTTITYMMMWGIYSDRVYGAEWVFVGFALLLDLFTWWSTLRK